MSTSTLPISSIAALSAPAAAAAATTTSGVASAAQTANLASEATFLQLLVAQLQNQDPEQPTDGTAFVTELAQFTTLSEDTESATDLDTIVAALPSLEPAAAATTAAAAAANNTTRTNTANPIAQ
jgi:flagellar basal-body rod modification protein FlgD